MMPRYVVNATVSYGGWVYVEADTESSALDEALDCDALDFEVDPGTAEVNFNVTPTVELESEA